jgi:hypothetical protein
VWCCLPCKSSAAVRPSHAHTTRRRRRDFRKAVKKTAARAYKLDGAVPTYVAAIATVEA